MIQRRPWKNDRHITGASYFTGDGQSLCMQKDPAVAFDSFPRICLKITVWIAKLLTAVYFM